MSGQGIEKPGSRLDAAGLAHQRQRDAVADTFGPLVALGTEILKALLFINAGAGAATIFFAGSALASRPALAQALVLPLAAFGFGLVVAGCATGWSYFAHEQRARAFALQVPSRHEPYLRDTDASRSAASRADRYRRLALGAVFVSVGSAVAGFAAAGVVMLLMIR